LRIKKGSVKDLLIEKEPAESAEGVGFFEFSDDYSVFDFGKMPDVIEGKGKSLCAVSSYNFKEIQKKGIRTHFVERCSSNKIKIKIVRIINPTQRKITEKDSNFLVPLEVIFRNSLPEGSSVFPRIEKGQISLKQLGLKKMPKPNEFLKNPIIDFSTKLEETDRYLSEAEAMALSGLNEKEFEELKKIALRVNDFLNRKSEKMGLTHADGKIELAMNSNRELMLVDVFGTLDENRFLFDGVQVSKQVLRDYYKTTPWYNELVKAKDEGAEKSKWPFPSPLPKKLLSIVSEFYKSFANEWVGEKTQEPRKLKEVVKEFREEIK